MTLSNSDAIDGQGVWRSNAYTITAFYYRHPERGFFRRASRLAAIGPSSPAWTRCRTRGALLLLTAALIAGLTVFGGGTVQADPVTGEVTNLRLSSDAPGELTITWDAPSDAPADYRVAWARADLSYLSWNASDETHRGNSYPGGADTSLTLSGLTGGETYKVRMRSRYNPGTADGWSGPWTGEVTVTVSSPPPTPVPTAVPTAVPTPVPASDEVTNVRLSSDAPGELTITWDAPSSTPADYRVAWAKNDLSYLSWDASNETQRGRFISRRRRYITHPCGPHGRRDLQGADALPVQPRNVGWPERPLDGRGDAARAR